MPFLQSTACTPPRTLVSDPEDHEDLNRNGCKMQPLSMVSHIAASLTHENALYQLIKPGGLKLVHVGNGCRTCDSSRRVSQAVEVSREVCPYPNPCSNLTHFTHLTHLRAIWGKQDEGSHMRGAIKFSNQRSSMYKTIFPEIVIFSVIVFMQNQHIHVDYVSMHTKTSSPQQPTRQFACPSISSINQAAYPQLGSLPSSGS